MNVNLVCKVGFKILAAVVAGAAVVIGIDKAVGGNKRAVSSNPGNTPDDKNPVFPTSGKVNENGGGGLQQVENNTPRSKTDMILSGIRGAGETCGKLFTVAQSLSQLIESAGSVFGNYQRSQGPSGGYYVPQQQSYQSGNIVWVPAPGSNCVMQAVPAQQNRW